MNFNFNLSRYAMSLSIVLCWVIIWWVLPHLSFSGSTLFSGVFVRLLLSVAVVGLVVYLSRVVKVRFAVSPLGEAEAMRFRRIKDDVLAVIEKCQESVASRFGFWATDKRPWYMMIGSEGAGKKTVLSSWVKDGAFRANAASHMNHQKDINWYVSDDAVFMDVQSEFASSAPASEVESCAWFEFLKCLRRKRIMRPLSGVVVVMNAAELNAPGRDTKVSALRVQLEKLQSISFTKVPVYVLFTHTDKLYGFEDFFSKCTHSVVDTPLGFTFSAAKQASAEQSEFSEAYGALVSHLSAHVLSNLSHESKVSRNMKTYVFPKYLASFGQVMEKQMQKLFPDSRADTLSFRGMYFTGLGATQTVGMKKENTHYFTGSLFKDVILHEASLGSVSERFVGRFNMAKRTFVVALFGILAALVLTWVCGFSKAEVYINQVQSGLDNWHYAKAAWQQDPNSPKAALGSMVPLQQLATLRERKFDHWWRYVGFGFPSAINNNLNAVYAQALQKPWREFVKTELGVGLGQAVNASKAPTQYKQMQQAQGLYQWLSGYLMMHQTARLDASQVKALLHGFWQNTYSAQPKAFANLQLLLGNMLALPAVPVRLDKALVSKAQAKLSHEKVADLAYAMLKLKADHAPGKALALGGKKVSAVFGNATPVTVPFFDTTKGQAHWIAGQQNKILMRVNAHKWVLGSHQVQPMTDARLQQDRAVLNARYEADVAQTWHKAIGQLTLKSPASLQALALWLKSLSRDGASFTVVLQQVLKNTKGVNTAQFKALQSTLDNRDYQDELGHVLSGLSSYVGDVASGLAPNEKALAATQKMAVKMPDVFVQAKALIAKSPWPLKGWVQAIVSNTQTQLYGAARLAFMQRYHNNWANSCHRLLGSGKASAVGITPHFSVAQFSRFFAPGAVADQFDKNQAAPFMADNLIGLAPTVIDNLQKARQVKATYFKGGKNPDVIFNVGPRYLSKNIAKFTLTVDGKSMMYENGPQVKNVLHWQGKGDHHVKLSFEALDGQTYTQTFSGPWAVITLFNSAKTTKLKDGNYDVAWTLDGYTAHYQVNVKGADFAGVVALKDIAC